MISSLQVFKEIEQKADDLLEWAKTNKVMFKDLDSIQEVYLRKVMNEPIMGFNLGLVNIRKLKSDADPFVISLAKAKGWTVITSEKPATPSGPNTRPKIPNVCQHYKIKSLSLPDFFREQKWQF